MSATIITVTQQKGGSGKTTIAANLAVAMAVDGKRVAILDTDPQGSLGRWFMARLEAGCDAGPKLTFKTASAWGARYEAHELAKTHDAVIIDTPPKNGIDAKPAIEVAHLVIVPVTPSPVDLWATEPTIDMVRNEKKPVMLVLNRTSRRSMLTRQINKELEQFHCSCAETLIGNRVAFAMAMRRGSSVIESEPKSLASREIVSLMGEVNATNTVKERAAA